MANSLETVTARAQREANSENRSMAVLNLNPHFAPLFVIRLWDDSMTRHDGRAWCLVARIDPQESAMTRRVIDHRLTVKAATAAIGGSLGYPSKMPGTSYGIPTSVCHVGGKLRDVPGSTCEKCYAHDRNNYKYTSVKIAQANRLASIDGAAWVESMAFLLNRKHAPDSKLGDGAGWHRWHDSGDIRDEAHFDAIVAVCERTPTVRHWLPTREVGLVAAWLRKRGETLATMYAVLPANLTVRVSATMVDGAPSAVAPNVSTVHRDTVPEASEVCPAPSQGNACGACRRCWNRNAHNTSYHVH